MKKIAYLLVAFCFISFLSAQEIVLNPKVKSTEGPREDINEKTASSVMTNNSTNQADSMISWDIISFDIPSGWQFDFCDPYDCISNLSLGSANTFKLKVGVSGPLKGNFYSNGIGGTGTVKIKIYYTGKPESADTLTLIAKGWSTGLKQIKNAAEVKVFPNPAYNQIRFKYPVVKPVEVSIYNILGNKVKTFIHSGNETVVTINDLAKGFYIVRFSENNMIFSKSFTKVE